MQLIRSPKQLALLLAAVAFPPVGAKHLSAQTEAMGPSELIRYLTYQSDRPDKHGMVKGQSLVFGCGSALAQDRDDRALTRKLVDLGPSALPPLEDALASFEAQGEQSNMAPGAAPGAPWLLLAYARLKGPAAYPRLHRMYANTGLASYAPSVDAALALAFGFTSYVSALKAAQIHQYYVCTGTDRSSTLSKTPCVAPQQEQASKILHCSRANEPRDSLDRLILAWLAGNRTSVEASLGENARSVLRSALVGRSWEILQIQLQPGISGPRSIGMGYRFSVPGRWSEPDETLDEERVRTSSADDTSRFEVETLFYDSTGNACGSRKLVFVKRPEAGWYKNGNPALPAPGPQEYLIDNPDILDLLRSVLACSAE